MVTLNCVYHHGHDRREWEVSAPNLSAAIREAYKNEPVKMSTDMRDAIYSDLIHRGMTDRYSWQRVYVVQGVD